MEAFAKGRPSSLPARSLPAGVSLAATVEELGYSAAASKEIFRSLLLLQPRFDESDLAQLLAVLARTNSRTGDSSASYVALQAALGSALPPLPDAPPLTSWNADAISDALLELRPELSWPTAVSRLDLQGFTVPDAAALALLCRLYARASREPFPLNALVGSVWNNTAGQLSFLRFAVAAPPEVLSWAHSTRRLALPEGTPASKAAASVLANGAWLCVDLHTVLARLAEKDGIAAVRMLLDAPAATCPEVLLLGAASMRTQWGLLQGELFAALLPSAMGLPSGMGLPLSLPTASPGLLPRLWATPSGHDAIVRALADAHSFQPGCLGRILDVCQELKALTAVLDATPPSFSVDLAALAARREYLNLEKWLAEAFASRGRPFIAECIRFLRVKAAGQPDGSSQGVNLSVETAALFFRALSAAAPSLPPDLVDDVRSVFASASALHPRLIALSTPEVVHATAAAAAAPETFSPDVEEEANSVFQKIYTGSQSIGAVIEMLSTFNARGGRRERDVFACMVHNLFDEYRFFPKYPDKELRITALLFGSLVANGLITGQQLLLALHYVLDALGKPPGSKMFTFGTDAAEQFATRMHEWPQFCAAAAQIAHLQSGAPELAALLARVPSQLPEAMGTVEVAAMAAPFGSEVDNETSFAQQIVTEGVMADISTDYSTPAPLPAAVAVAPAVPRPTPVAPATPRLEPSAAPFLPAPSFASSLNIDTLLGAPENFSDALPDETTVDRVHFACNNLSAANVAAKASDIAGRLEEAHWPWLATYLVVKRAALEPNFHALYASLLEALAQPKLTATVVASSVANIRVLLRGDKIKTASGERSLLKNLGSWLGVLTIGRGRPLLARQLDLKALLLDAYSQGSMIAVIPFVAKVLEPARGSRIFAPPNPWTVSILGLFAEIYAHPDLKLNLKFEVERIFKHMGVNMADAAQPGILVGRPRLRISNADFVGEKPPPAPPPAPDADFSKAKLEAEAAAAAPPLSGAWPLANDASLLTHLSVSVVFSPEVALYVDRLALKRFLPLALERAIRDVVTPVVERSVTIACMTTRELVLKDFSAEADEASLRHGAHLMAASLAGSLALVTCKEPLRANAVNALRGLLALHRGASEVETSVLEQAVAVACSDNLELGCTLIEAAAQDRARRDVDDVLAAAYALRHAHREASPGVPFHDPAYVAGRFPAMLPDALRPVPFRERPAQMRVYEDFAAVKGSALFERAGVSRPTPGMPDGPLLGSGDSLGPPAAGAVDSNAALERLRVALSRFEAVVANEAATPDDVRAALAAAAEAIPVGAGRDDIACALAAFALKRVFERRALVFGASAALALLEIAVTVSRRAGAEVLAATLYGDEEPRMGAVALDRLLRCGGVNPAELDAALAALLGGPRVAAASEMAVSLVQLALLAPDACLPPAKLGRTLDKLAALADGRQSPMGDKLVMVLEAVREVCAQPGARPRIGGETGEPPGGDLALREQVAAQFDEWARVCDAPAGDALYTSFFSGFLASSLMVNEEAQSSTFRILTELVVAHCLGSDTGGGSTALNFAAVDAYGRLVLTLARYHSAIGGGVASTVTRIALFSRAMAAIVSVLLRDQDERGSAFNPRPYFRILCGWLTDLSAPDPALDLSSPTVASVFALSLIAAQPLRAPGFAFAWLELVSHRALLPRLSAAGTGDLTPGSPASWHLFSRLLTGCLRFLEPRLRAAELSEPARVLYRGLLRVLLLLLHDVPEFLCDHAPMLCDAIPPSCIQMRNLVLSAFPRSMRLPDPFTPNLKVDMLPEISISPRVAPETDAVLLEAAGGSLVAELDAFLVTHKPASLPTDLRMALLLPPAEAAVAGTRYNVALLNAIVLRCGSAAIEAARREANGDTSAAATSLASTAMDLFTRFANEMDVEGRYLFLNAVANQLRYPNAHTHYFSCVLLFLFGEASQEIVREQVTRVLLERLIVNRPHPWGLLITFIELIKNQRYAFWSHSFTRATPEIERLFSSVARSCSISVPPAGA